MRIMEGPTGRLGPGRAASTSYDRSVLHVHAEARRGRVLTLGFGQSRASDELALRSNKPTPCKKETVKRKKKKREQKEKERDEKVPTPRRRDPLLEPLGTIEDSASEGILPVCEVSSKVVHVNVH